jgi:RhtB (resistance to homoserine/threonine) family protein
LDERFAAYVAVMALLILTPGPDTALVIRHALGSGARAATATALGIGLGSLVWALAALLGVEVLLQTSAAAFTVLKLAGAGYLAYLGIRTLIAGRRSTRPASTTPMADRAAFQQGVLGNLLNPKAAAIFVTVLPQFIAAGDSPLRLVLMVVAYEAILVPWLSLYAKVVSHAGQSRFGARVRQWLNRVTGVVLIGFGVRLAFERR